MCAISQRRLPPEIQSLKSLQVFLFRKNNTQKLHPECLTGLDQLQTLSFEANKLKRLPASINTVTALVDLNLANNFLRKLPEVTAQCSTVGKFLTS